jgi:hypothetical protein
MLSIMNQQTPPDGRLSFGRRFRDIPNWPEKPFRIEVNKAELRFAVSYQLREWALQPAVIARKVSPCPKTSPGAYALAASSVVEALSDLFRVPQNQTAPA